MKIMNYYTHRSPVHKEIMFDVHARMLLNGKTVSSQSKSFTKSFSPNVFICPLLF